MNVKQTKKKRLYSFLGILSILLAIFQVFGGLDENQSLTDFIFSIVLFLGIGVALLILSKIENIKMCDAENAEDERYLEIKKLNDKRKVMIGIIAGLVIGTAIVCPVIEEIIISENKNINHVEDMNETEKEDYYECILLNQQSPFGATFNINFSNVKDIVGRNLSIGDLNNSSGGWIVISSGESYTEYNIVSSTGIWSVNVGVDSNGKIFMISCATVGLDNGYPNSAEIEAFSSVFAAITEISTESVTSALTELCEYNRNVRFYDCGVQWTFQVIDGGCRFGITSMSEQYWNSIQ